ncbi:DNA glycosylase [Penicillium hispanicum]|uniref:DNA glycosylase n=1 Tax=Penicillium hispanicum TaxID=1080232 RepID=UPI00254089BD|nr:DNA glycosylase [Penicillium hispanicum]KAJ5595393.1 DNA glycosylase [Penicillium hispanicum]
MDSTRVTRSAAKLEAGLTATSQNGIATPPGSTTPQTGKRKRTTSESLISADGVANDTVQPSESAADDVNSLAGTKAPVRTKAVNPITKATPKASLGTTKRTAKIKKRATSRKGKSSKRVAGKRIAKAKAKALPKQATKSQKLILKPPTLQSTAPDELPHNLGTLQSLLPASESFSVVINGPNKENTAPSKPEREAQQTVDEADTKPADTKARRSNYRLTPGKSPFPSHRRPTREDCEKVNEILTKVHGEYVAPKTIPEPSLTVTGCGEVPSVLDALIRTLLSGATTSTNSAKAFNGLVERFGILQNGVGKGSVNWDAVRQASLEDVFQAMKSGGLASIKSKSLKAILDMVHKENQDRRSHLLSNGAASPDKEEATLLPEKAEKDKQYEIACADQHFLSLNHLHNLSKDAAMIELTKYPGIGPKTAACVILFCLQRPCFAVDTHIFRITKWLGWVPATGSNEITAFSHLEVRIPDELKYSLHQLFIRHGRTCPRCRAITGETSEGWEEGCPIDHLVRRTGVRKPGGSPKKRKRPQNGRNVKKTTRSKQTAKLKTGQAPDAKQQKVQSKKKEELNKKASKQQGRLQKRQLKDDQFSADLQQNEMLQKRQQPDRGTKPMSYLTVDQLEPEEGEISTDNEIYGLSQHSDSEFIDMADG